MSSANANDKCSIEFLKDFRIVFLKVVNNFTSHYTKLGWNHWLLSFSDTDNLNKILHKLVSLCATCRRPS